MAVNFNADGDYLRSTTSAPSGSAWTMAAWVNRQSNLSYFECIFDIGADDPNFFAILSNNDSTNFITVWNGNDLTVSSTALATGAWHHFAATVDGTGTNDGTVYLDGVNVHSFNGNSGITPDEIILAESNFGAFVGATERFNGYMANVQIFDVALTQAQVQSLMFTFVPSVFPNLNRWSPLIGTGGTSFLDYSGNGRDWTESGTVTHIDGPPIAWDFTRSVIVPAVAAPVVPANRAKFLPLLGVA